MGIFDRFRSKPDPVMQKASQLLDLAHVTAVSAATTFLDEFDSPELHEAFDDRGTEPWDFFVTASCVFIALNALDNTVSRSAAQSIRKAAFHPPPNGSNAPTDSIEEHHRRFLASWRADGQRAVADCSDFVRRAVSTAADDEATHALAVALGQWVLWNVYQKAPPSTDARLAGAIGLLAARTFASYWTAP